MTVFECEDSSDGIFTGIYDAWASRLGHANVRLQLQGMHTLELFTQYRQVVPDAGKAEKVARTIRRKMGEESYQIIFRAAMAKSGEKETAFTAHWFRDCLPISVRRRQPRYWSI